MRRTLPLFLALLLPACVASRFTDNEPFDPDVIEGFVPGSTTAADVTNVLGPPVRVVELDVRSAYLYEFSNSKTTGLVLLLVNFVNSDARFDRVWLFFDSRDVLTHTGSQLSAHRARFAMPWVGVHDADRNAKADAEYAKKRAEAEAKAAAAAKEAQAEAERKKSSEAAASAG